MRIASIFIALISIVALYFFIFQRDMLFDISTPNVETSDETTSDPDDIEKDGAKEKNMSATDLSDDAHDASSARFAPPAEKSTDIEKSVSVVAVHSTAQTLDTAVVLRGETEAARIVHVSAETDGRVISEPIRKGAYVEAGQALCVLDPGTRGAILTGVRAALPTTKARISEATAQLQEAETNLENARKLAKGGYASDTRVIAAKASVESAKAGLITAHASVDTAQSNIAAAEREIENLTISAPFSGLLETDTAELGTLMQTGAVCATIIQLDPIKLVGFAPETSVDKIQVGSTAGARFVTGDNVVGQVTFLSKSADPATRTFRVEVEIPNPDFAIRDGQTVEMAIASAGKPAHLVAQSSLTLNDAGDLGLRLVGDDSHVVFAPINVIRDTIDGMWVTGLGDTADIITVGHEYVTQGVLVEPHFEEK